MAGPETPPAARGHPISPSPGTPPPSGNVAFPVRQRFMLHRNNYLASAALQAAKLGHLLNFSSQPRIARCLGRPASCAAKTGVQRCARSGLTPPLMPADR